MRRLLALVLLAPLAAAAPEQVHLGLRDADALAGYTVSWVETDPAAEASFTFHGPEGDVVVEGRRIDGPTPGLVYEGRLPRLAPGDEASYTLGGRTWPVRVPDPAGPLRLAALGDMGVTREAGATVRALEAAGVHFVLHAGDVSYAEGDPLTWKRWFELVEPVAASAPWLPALGNHEGDVAGLATDDAAVVDPAEQAVFRQRFPLPRETFWWSFDVGGVHVVALDTFSQVVMPREAVDWLASDLAAARDADWIVAYLHEPPYSSNDAHGSSPRAWNAFARVLEEGGVDLVLSAHDHAYERTHPLRDGAPGATASTFEKGAGTVYVVTGGAGAPLYTGWVEPAPAWSAARHALHHVVLLDVTRERIEGRVLPTTGDRFADAFSIVRPSGAGPQDAATPFPVLATLAAAGAAALARGAFGPARAR